MYINAEHFHENPFEVIRLNVPKPLFPLPDCAYKGDAYYIYSRMLYLVGVELTNYFFIRLLQDVISTRNLCPDGYGVYRINEWVDAGSVEDLGGIEYSRFNKHKVTLRYLLETTTATSEEERRLNILIKEIYK